MNLPDPFRQSPKAPRQLGCGVVAFVLFVAMLMGGGALAWYLLTTGHPDGKAVRAVSGRITWARDDGDDRRTFGASEKPDLWFRVMLENVPLGPPLELECEWIDPDGRIAHRNRYSTKPINHTPWPTHAHFQLSPDSPTGKWHVRLMMDRRELSVCPFEVHDR
jgi:hypothetical protein